MIFQSFGEPWENAPLLKIIKKSAKNWGRTEEKPRLVFQNPIFRFGFSLIFGFIFDDFLIVEHAQGGVTKIIKNWKEMKKKDLFVSYPH